jgi:acetyl-CoA carboxylase beta subunit
MLPLIPLISAGASLLGGLFGGKQAKKSATQASGGARLQDLMPQIMQLIQQQQANSQQNYQGQMAQRQANMGLENAVRQMAMNLTPNRVKPPQGM